MRTEYTRHIKTELRVSTFNSISVFLLPRTYVHFAAYDFADSRLIVLFVCYPARVNSIMNNSDLSIRLLSVSSSIIVLANIVVLFIYAIVNIADYLLV